jgi:CRISPR-associated protein Cas1
MLYVMAEIKFETSELCSADDRAWTDRAELWSRRASLKMGNRSKRERRREPIVLCGHGVSLRIAGGALTIRNGFTHYPQKQETYRFFKGELTIPPRIIMLDGSGSISFDVLAWLSEQNVPLIRIDWQGNVQSVLANNSYAASRYRVEWQRETRADPRQRMAFCIDLITRKIEGCIKTLEKSISARPHGNTQ